MLKAAKLFQPGMVVQKGKPLKIWGEAEPFAEVAVRFQNASGQTNMESGAQLFPLLNIQKGKSCLFCPGKRFCAFRTSLWEKCG